MIQINEKSGGKCREIIDTENPRIFFEEWRCAGCGEWTNSEEVVWAKDDGTLSTTHADAKPWCEGCCPEEPEDDY